MSYSFSIKAATKAEAKAKVAEAFDTVVTNQVSHKADRDAAVAAAGAFIDILAEPQENDEYDVSLNGSLSWPRADESAYTSAEVTIRAHLRNKI